MKKPRIQAEPAYEHAHLVAQDLVTRISELLTDMPAPDGETRIHWGHVGSVNHVNELLSQAVEFLESHDR